MTKYFADWLSMDEPRAEAFNEAMEALGCPLRIKQFTPEQCVSIVADNEDLLKQYKSSQRMAGDDPGETTEASRPNCMHLSRRMADGKWRWYLSKMSMLPNGGYNDGISRVLSCVASNIPFWSLVWEAAQADDFQYFDEGLASRSHKDGILNNDPDLADRNASIESQVLPRLYAYLYGGSHTTVAADQIRSLQEDYSSEIEAANEFVIKNKPARPKLIARAHIVHVGIKKNSVAEDLLTSFALGAIDRNDVNGRAMFELAGIVKRNTRRLHDEKIWPAIEAAIETASMGLDFMFEENKTKVDGKNQTTGIVCVPIKRRRKNAASA